MKLRERQKKRVETVSYLAKWYHILYHFISRLRKGHSAGDKKKKKEAAVKK